MKIKPCPKCESENVEYTLRSHRCLECFFTINDVNVNYHVWNMLSDYMNNEELEDETNQTLNAIKRDVRANYDDIVKLTAHKADIQYYKDVYKDMVDKYYKLEERLSKLEGTGIDEIEKEWKKLRPGDLVQYDGSTPPNLNRKQLKPVNEACLGYCCLFRGRKHILTAICMDDSFKKSYKRYQYDEYYKPEDVMRCPEVRYGDDDE